MTIDATEDGAEDARLRIAIAFATDRGSRSANLAAEDFKMAHPRSLLGQAWRDAGIAIAALPQMTHAAATRGEG